MTTYVQDYDENGNKVYDENGRAVFIEKRLRVYGPDFKKGDKGSHMIIEDIQPYQSTIDGSVISSRNKHKAHLRQHGCVEVGNEPVEKLNKHIRPNRPDISTKENITKDVLRAYEQAG